MRISGLVRQGNGEALSDRSVSRENIKTVESIADIQDRGHEDERLEGQKRHVARSAEIQAAVSGGERFVVTGPAHLDQESTSLRQTYGSFCRRQRRVQD
jgi:hypothetical protein